MNNNFPVILSELCDIPQVGTVYAIPRKDKDDSFNLVLVRQTDDGNIFLDKTFTGSISFTEEMGIDNLPTQITSVSRLSDISTPDLNTVYVDGSTMYPDQNAGYKTYMYSPELKKFVVIGGVSYWSIKPSPLVLVNSENFPDNIIPDSLHTYFVSKGVQTNADSYDEYRIVPSRNTTTGEWELNWEKTSGSGGGVDQIQSDWDQSNTHAVDYIKNKPNNIPIINDTAPANDTVYSSNKLLKVLRDSIKPFRQFMTTQVMSAEGRMALGEGNDKFGLGDNGYYDSTSNILYYGGLHPTNKTYGLVAYDLSTRTSPQFVGFSDLDLSNLGLYDGGPTIRSVVKYGTYLYVGVRSNKPNKPSNGVNNNSVWGAIICVNSSDLSIVWTKKLNAKVTGIKIYAASNNNVYMAVACQMSYIQFYTINQNDPTEITLRDTQYTKEWQEIQPSDYNPYVNEHQHGDFCETSDNKVIYISCGFGDGFHLYDVTNIVSGQRAILYNWLAWSSAHQPIWYIDGTTAFHTMDCIASYPYFYATMAPGTSILTKDNTNGTTKHRMGLLAMNISNLNDMQASVEYISVDDMNIFIASDPRPTCIERVGNYIFLNNGTEGVAVFDVSVAGSPRYVGTNVVKDLIEAGGLYNIGENYLLVGDDPTSMNTGTPAYEAKKYITLFKVANT